MVGDAAIPFDVVDAVYVAVMREIGGKKGCHQLEKE